MALISSIGPWAAFWGVCPWPVSFLRFQAVKGRTIPIAKKAKIIKIKETALLFARHSHSLSANLIIDGLLKSRLTGENRCPGF
ncbi:MAG: hypothetical protein A2169_04855 [Deltaproteobacteria bacterium RBG_13_47_9]|nr:MAG: hypothetical protein A2169_04855 [Deltaproteobacteria bacterium RBG_13_47_9]